MKFLNLYFFLLSFAPHVKVGLGESFGDNSSRTFYLNYQPNFVLLGREVLIPLVSFLWSFATLVTGFEGYSRGYISLSLVEHYFLVDYELNLI